MLSAGLPLAAASAVRQLYTDDEVVLFEASRPILLNGIEEVVSRPDLGDRAIFLTLAPIADGERRPEAELWREFEVARPRILGALLDAVVHGLRAINHVQLQHLPRMADFALWAAACETVLWPNFCSGLCGKPTSGDREHHRRRPSSQLRAHDYGRKRQLDRDRIRPVAFVCGECSRGHFDEAAMGKKPAGPCRPITTGANVP
jgi:hypothetical protein